MKRQIGIFGMNNPWLKNSKTASGAYKRLIEKRPVFENSSYLESPFLSRKEMALAFENQIRYKDLYFSYAAEKMALHNNEIQYFSNWCPVIFNRVLKASDKITGVCNKEERLLFGSVCLDVSLDFSKEMSNHYSNHYLNLDLFCEKSLELSDMIVKEIDKCNIDSLQVSHLEYESTEHSSFKSGRVLTLVYKQEPWFSVHGIGRGYVPNITNVFSRSSSEEEEEQYQVDHFLKELAVRYEDGQRNFKDLYSKYPKVNIGIRRAIVYLKKQGHIERT